MTTRRELLLAMGVLAALPAYSQQAGKVWCVGFIGPEKRPVSIDSERFGAFSRGLRDLGYIEGKNLIIEWRFAEGKTDRLAETAAEFVRLKVDVIVPVGLPAARAAQKVTTAIPIVFVGPGDPVGVGLVKSLARPGGNITGPSTISGDLGPKRLELLLEMVGAGARRDGRPAGEEAPPHDTRFRVFRADRLPCLRLRGGRRDQEGTRRRFRQKQIFGSRTRLRSGHLRFELRKYGGRVELF